MIEMNGVFYLMSVLILLTGNIETGEKEGKVLGSHKASEGSKGHKGHVLCLAVSSDGKFLVRRNTINVGKQGNSVL